MSPDITMCKGDNCPKRQDCYRYTATPCVYRQSYFAKPPCTGKYYTECEYFWKDEKGGV